MRKADDDAAFEATVLFSLLGLLLFLGMALITDSEATRHGLLQLG